MKTTEVRGAVRWGMVIALMAISASALRAQVSIQRFPLTMNVQWTVTYADSQDLSTNTTGVLKRTTRVVRITNKDLLNLATNSSHKVFPKGARLMTAGGWELFVSDKSGTNVLESLTADGIFQSDEYAGFCLNGRETIISEMSKPSQIQFVIDSGTSVKTGDLSFDCGDDRFDLHVLSRSSYSIGGKDRNGNLKRSQSTTATVMGQVSGAEHGIVLSGTLSASGSGIIQVIRPETNSPSNGGGASAVEITVSGSYPFPKPQP